MDEKQLEILLQSLTQLEDSIKKTANYCSSYPECASDVSNMIFKEFQTCRREKKKLYIFLIHEIVLDEKNKNRPNHPYIKAIGNKLKQIFTEFASCAEEMQELEKAYYVIKKWEKEQIYDPAFLDKLRGIMQPKFDQLKKQQESWNIMNQKDDQANKALLHNIQFVKNNEHTSKVYTYLEKLQEQDQKTLEFNCNYDNHQNMTKKQIQELHQSAEACRHSIIHQIMQLQDLFRDQAQNAQDLFNDYNRGEPKGFMNYIGHINDYPNQLFLITWLMDDKLIQILYQDMDIKWRRVIGYSQNGEPHQPNVLIGYLLDGTPYAIWDIYQGTIQRVGQSIDKLIISSSQIIDINQFIDGMLLILTKNEGIYLYDSNRNQIRICFNEYLKYVKNPLRMRFSIDTLYMGYKDGYLSLWEINKAIAEHLDDNKKGTLLVQDCQARFHITESELIDFDVDGYRLITLQDQCIEILALDKANQEKIYLAVYKIDLQLDFLDFQSDHIILYRDMQIFSLLVPNIHQQIEFKNAIVNYEIQPNLIFTAQEENVAFYAFNNNILSTIDSKGKVHINLLQN